MLRRLLRKQKRIVQLRPYKDRLSTLEKQLESDPVMKSHSDETGSDQMDSLLRKTNPINFLSFGIRRDVRNLLIIASLFGSQSMSMNQTAAHNSSIFVIANDVSSTQWLNRDLEPDDFTVYINPIILEYSEEKSVMTEYCFSYPNKKVEVERYSTIRVLYTNELFELKDEILTGSKARVFQHEYSHQIGEEFDANRIVKDIFDFKYQSQEFLKVIIIFI